jgi:hypothetical protein
MLGMDGVVGGRVPVTVVCVVTWSMAVFARHHHRWHWQECKSHRNRRLPRSPVAFGERLLGEPNPNAS